MNQEAWNSGVNDAIKIIKDRRYFLLSLAPAAMPAKGVIEILDEILILLMAMQQRGEYSSKSLLSNNS